MGESPHRLYRFEDIEDLIYKVFRIIETYIHPDYTLDSSYNDIALLKLEEAIVFGDDYQPACLNTEIIEEIIWKSNGTFFYLLRELNVTEYKKCAILYSQDVGLWPSGVIDEIQICAWDYSGNETCPIDSGNDLQYKVDGLGNVRGHHVVAGVGSVTVCGSEVFTIVSAYLDWIEEIVWKDETEPETVTFVFTN